MLRSRLPQIAAEVDTMVDAVLKRGADLVAERAQARLEPHRLTGRLQGAIHVHDEREGFYVLAGGDQDVPEYRSRDVFWGPFLEFGTSRLAPHPFLVPALEESQDEITGMVRAGLGRL